MEVIFRIIFYIVVLLIFIGDTILLVLTGIIQAYQNLCIAIAKSIIHVLNSVHGIGIKTISWVKSLFPRPSHNSAFTVPKKHKKEEVTLNKKAKKPQHHIVIKFRYFLFGIFVAMMIILCQRSYEFVKSLPNPQLIGRVNFSVSTQIYDRNGNLLYDVYRDQNRTPINIKELPQYVTQATLAIEDKNFYRHNGIAIVGGVLRAIKDTYKTGDLQGGSTITQQLVKTSLLTPERTFERKIKEAILALWAERIYTKDQILEMYLNQVSYGGTAYGIEEASRQYFDKSAKDLDLNQAAFLAGLTRAPSSYSPYVNPILAMQRRNEVLKSMVDAGYIAETVYANEVNKPLSIQPPKTFLRAPHFVFYIKSLLEQKYGARQVEEGGLRVVTTLDINLQDKVEAILKTELEKISNLNVHNGAALVTAPSTGEILAMVGSKDYYEEPYGAYNATTAKRQPGSSIKPLMYSLAIDSGQFTAASILQDTPVVYQAPGAPPYRPVNYDGRFHGPVTLRYALANSYNIPAVRTLNELGVGRFIDHARKLGITTWDTPERYGLSLALGGAEVKLTDMAVAFGTFANYGKKVNLNPIISVEDYRGRILEKFSEPTGEQVLSPETGFIMSDILSDNKARESAFGPNSSLVIPGQKVAVKTGTTNSKRDNWTDGYTRKYFVGVWVGNNDNTPMNPILTSGITGASPIWNRVMQTVLQDNPHILSSQSDFAFSVPRDIVTQPCHYNAIEYFIRGTETKGDCKSKALTVSPQPSISFGNQF